MLHSAMSVGAAILVLGIVPSLGAVSENLLTNGAFDQGVDGRGIPVGWSLYGGGGTGQLVEPVAMAGGGGILIHDGDPTQEIGLTQACPAEPGVTYQAGVTVRSALGASTAGAYLQLRFLPSNHFEQAGLAAGEDVFETISVKATAPPATTQVRVYIYTHRDPTPRFIVARAELISGVPPPPPPPPEPIPPVYAELKQLHLETELVKAGMPAAAIVAPASGMYDRLAERIQQAIAEMTGVTVPIVSDDSPDAAVPITRNLMALGNRSTNRTIEELYNQYFTLLDLRYPGPGGYVVRTLHSPFGDGRNVVFVGGSDDASVDEASRVLVQHLKQADSGRGRLAIGRLAEIKLGEGISVPTDVREFETWEASAGYGSVGYFGWNSLSKRLAMYYMTGEEFHAREFLRLAFPDVQARKEIAEIDGERIENKDEPLGGPYHYNAHMMILFWDLVEESPVFSDEERLRVTNAFSKQLNHRKDEGIYRLTRPPGQVGSRHGQWSAVSLFCLGRYFQNGYPDPIWAQCVRGAQLHFAPLREHAWIAGESDNLFWYNTGIAPIFTYMLLSGDRGPMEGGSAQTLLRGQEMLISGRVPDWALRSASIGYLHKAAYVTGDGRWLEYRDRAGVDLGVFRLGQSFWPDDTLQPQLPDDLVGKWSINYLPKPMWGARRTGFALEESFLFGSFRSAPDASGDYILIDGFNGASRNPYHTFAILELRMDGHTLLEGYRNQVLTRADGLVEPKIAMDAALLHADVLGGTALAVAQVPDAAYCNWRRTLLQRIGRYALVVDDLTFRADSENIEVQTLWETPRGAWDSEEQALRITSSGMSGRGESAQPQETSRVYELRPSDVVEARRQGKVTTLEWLGGAREGARLTFFSLLARYNDERGRELGCVRIAPNAAALALPSSAVAVAGEYGKTAADLAVLGADHLYGHNLTSAGLGTTLIRADAPVDVDWDFVADTLHVVADTDTRVMLRVDSTGTLDGEPATGEPGEDGLTVFAIPAGRHVWGRVRVRAVAVETISAELASLVSQGRQERSRLARTGTERPAPSAPPLAETMTATVGGRAMDLAIVRHNGVPVVYVAEAKTVHVLSAEGPEVRKLEADGEIRILRWWDEHDLLLVGCADEQVIAFDTAGNRRWVFTSEMDPEVFRAAKTYWFKSAPGHSGIHGLYSGVFIDGKSQAFVGSACTLEILDENGKLIKRMPQFWGDPSTFAMVPGPEGSLNLLAARKSNGTNTVRIINNRVLEPGERAFYTVPPGHTYVPGWSSMNRHHLFHEDLDGDGISEVISEINGTWNRVTVWSADGTPLYDASFGPGDRIPAKNMRDLDIADLDGDGKKEIIAATSSGLVVALDHQCRKLWSTRLSSPPTVMKCMTSADGSPWIVVGCEDGSVRVLNGTGEPIRLGAVNGVPTCIEGFSGQGGAPVVLIATSGGEVKGFQLGQ